MNSVQTEPRARAKYSKGLAYNASDRDQWADDDVLEDGPFDGVHEVCFRGTVTPAAELRNSDP